MDAAAIANRPMLRAGRYAVYDEVAGGGMATVHLGRYGASAGFARTVAIKRLHPQFAKAPEFVSMFTDEARLAARLRHPNVVSTLDVVSADGELLLVMEYIHGESLANVLRLEAGRGKLVPVPVVVAVMVGALYGLHAAHEATTETGERLGVIHRDVSPQNIIVGADGVPRVVDFGIAKAIGRIQVTRDGEVKGKTAYMPPEQLAGRALDQRADVYAASVVLWEAITGHRLFVGDSPGQIMWQVFSATVEPPSTYAPSVPQELDALVLRGLSRDPAERFSTALEMAAALERVVVPATAREVAAWVREVAASSLETRAARIEQIESLETESLQTPPPGAERVSSSESGIVERPLLQKGELGVSPTTSCAPPRAASRPARRRWLVASALVAAVSVPLAVFVHHAATKARGSVALAGAGDRAPGSADAALAAPSSVGAAVEGFDVATPPSAVTLTVESRPAGVQIAIDGKTVGTTPAQLSLPRSDRASVMELSLRGFSPIQRQVTPTRDQAIYVTLTHEDHPAPRRARKGDGASDFQRFE